MSNLFFSSDHHFGHANVIKYCYRPYSSIEEMNEGLIEKWNKVVKPTDRVYYLGDFSMSTAALPFVARLNGHKILVPGNHDKCFAGHKGFKNQAEKYLQAGFKEIQFQPLHLVYEGIDFLAWHLPYKPTEDHPAIREMRYLEWRPADEGKWLLHGHTHGKYRKLKRMIDVGVDAWDLSPVSWEEIKELIDNPSDHVPAKTSGRLNFSSATSVPQQIDLG